MEVVGIPKEIKTGEQRVALTPEGVRVLSRRDIEVWVEQSAGQKAGFSDEEYRRAGAHIADDAPELWSRATLVEKVKEPIEPEFKLFRENQILFTFLHLASKEQCRLLRALVDSGVTAIGYETVELNGYTPLLKPMSIAAGKLSAYFAGLYKNLAEVSGREVKVADSAKKVLAEWIEQFPGAPLGYSPGRVVVLGGGQAGLAAAEMACRMGAEVILMELDARRRQYLKNYCQDHNLVIAIRDARSEFLDDFSDADVIIAAVHRTGQRAPEIISKELLEKISKMHRKLLIDIAIDQGGNIAESHPTTYEAPLYLDSLGNIRFAVTNMPSICPRQTSLMLEGATLDYTLVLAEKGLTQALERFPELAKAVNVRAHQVLLESVAKAHAYQ